MAKKDSSISKEDLKETTGAFVGGLEAFRALSAKEGVETYGGLNILNISPGKSAGPFVLAEILKDQTISKKIKKPVDIYVGTHDGIRFRMPAAASFVEKAKEAGLNFGDEFHVARDEDYKSKYGTAGKAYLIAITKRA